MALTEFHFKICSVYGSISQKGFLPLVYIVLLDITSVAPDKSSRWRGLAQRTDASPAQWPPLSFPYWSWGGEREDIGSAEEGLHRQPGPARTSGLTGEGAPGRAEREGRMVGRAVRTLKLRSLDGDWATRS